MSNMFILKEGQTDGRTIRYERRMIFQTILLFQILMVQVIIASTPLQETTRTLGTYNAGLTDRIPNRSIRASYIQEHLKNLRTDVICLQEYWFLNDVKDLLRTLQKTYPYSFSAVHNSTSELLGKTSHGACSVVSMNRIMNEVRSQGCLRSQNETAILNCAVQKAKVLDLPQECITCVTISGINRIFSDCVGQSSGGVNIPGLVLLSKLPIRKTEKVDFIPGVKQLLPRSYLLAEVEGIGQIACTHLTANLGKIYYEPYLLTTFESWEDQNLHDANSLVKDLAPLQRAIIIGDLNCGPNVPKHSVTADFPESFETFTKNNFTAPYVRRIGKCTYCQKNALVAFNRSLIIDHVLLKGYQTRRVRRILHRSIPGHDYPPSDHFGIEVTIKV